MLISSLQRKLEEDCWASAFKFSTLLPNHFKLMLASEWWVISWGEWQRCSACLMATYLLVLEHWSSTQLKDYTSQAPLPGGVTWPHSGQWGANRYQLGNGDRGLPGWLFKWSWFPRDMTHPPPTPRFALSILPFSCCHRKRSLWWMVGDQPQPNPMETGHCPNKKNGCLTIL